MNSKTIILDFLILANSLCQRVVVKMINRNVDDARNMTSIEETSDTQVNEDDIALVENLRG